MRAERIDVQRGAIVPQPILVLVPEQFIRLVGHGEPRLGERGAARFDDDVVVDRDKAATGKTQQRVVERPAIRRFTGCARAKEPGDLTLCARKLGAKRALEGGVLGAPEMRNVQSTRGRDCCAIGLFVRRIARIVDDNPVPLGSAARLEPDRAFEQPGEELGAIRRANRDACEWRRSSVAHATEA